jgi:16S rRNA (cytosine1402-N4)-methyltransferase
MPPARHVPVMPVESLELLAVKPEGVYLDCTTGMGGHTRLIAERLTTGFVIANDRDQQALGLARENTATVADRICFHYGGFDSLAEAVSQAGASKVDGLLADLGTSMFQLTEPSRGFSFMQEGPLDMRMDTTGGQTADDLVNHSDEKTLADLIFQFGEERRARRIARAIVRARPLRSTLHLADVVERLLESGPELLNSGGRMVVIAFHSIDDRQVKEKFRALAQQGRASLLTKHPLTPSDEECERNAASRSARLRAVEMK